VHLDYTRLVKDFTQNVSDRSSFVVNYESQFDEYAKLKIYLESQQKSETSYSKIMGSVGGGDIPVGKEFVFGPVYPAYSNGKVNGNTCGGTSDLFAHVYAQCAAEQVCRGWILDNFSKEKASQYRCKGKAWWVNNEGWGSAIIEEL